MSRTCYRDVVLNRVYFKLLQIYMFYFSLPATGLTYVIVAYTGEMIEHFSLAGQTLSRYFITNLFWRLKMIM